MAFWFLATAISFRDAAVHPGAVFSLRVLSRLFRNFQGIIELAAKDLTVFSSLICSLADQVG
ncbi:hypothetical protein [Nitrosospira sp. NpAV]|uniref:hypothetical protein n=1 Tax=Nitrosospira sp. NpAV TaxID=58133 RepID=UPI0005A1A0B7|nr:hypothetical protein [Nitrosospira sp. NpAV]KIO48330.1 hypothetical protein SQ11_11205 [Nitrosospira sp. NpAV]